MFLLLWMAGCATRAERVDEMWCDEVRKCDPDAGCWLPDWRRDPRCDGCEPLQLDVCFVVLEGRRDEPGCLRNDAQGREIPFFCEQAFDCPDDAPPDCRIGDVTDVLRPP